MTDTTGEHDPHSSHEPKLVGRQTLLVALGGSVGVWARYVLTASPLGTDNEEWAILVINIVGCFMLGLAVATLDRRIVSLPRRHDLRALLATGVLGGFTTYSALAVHVATLGRDGSLVAATLYAVVTVTVGLVAVVVGKTLGNLGRVDSVQPR